MSRILGVLRVLIVVAAVAHLAGPRDYAPMNLQASMNAAYWEPAVHVSEDGKGLRVLFTALAVILLLAE